MLHGLSGAPIWVAGDNNQPVLAGILIEHHPREMMTIVGVRWHLVAPTLGL